MAFRSSEYLQRNELVRYQLDDVIRLPVNGQHQTKNGYKFTINDRSSFYDWYNAYFEVQFQLQVLADGNGYADDRITVINGSHSLIKHLMIKSAGKIVYDTDNLHNVTFVKNLLEYSDDYSRSVGKNSLWYLDTDKTTAVTNFGYEARRLLTKAAANNALADGGKDVNVIIPLNRWSFFEELNDKMLVPMQLQFNIELNSDDELVHMVNGIAAARVVINRFILWVPRLTPRDSMYDKFVSSFLKETKWKYMREMYNVSAPTITSGFFQISSSIDNVKHIFVYLKNSYRDANEHRQAESTPYTMDTFALSAPPDQTRFLSNCRLEYGNGVFYPETEYDSESKTRIFNDVMAYAMRKNDYNTGTQLNTANYNLLYPLIYFDLTYQSEKVTRDPKQLIFRYRLSANANRNFSVHAVVLYEEILKIDKIGNELVIV